MIRTLTILAAVVALAVSASPASAAKVIDHEGAFLGIYGGHYRDGDFAAVTDGTSNTLQSASLAPQPGGSNGIIAILIG